MFGSRRRAPLAYCLSRHVSNMLGLFLFLSCTALASGPDAGRFRFTDTPAHNPAFYRARLP